MVFTIISTLLSPSLIAPSAAALTDLFPRDGLCGLSPEDRLGVQQQIQNGVDLLRAAVGVPQCGPGLWRQVADFDVSGLPSECPSGWPFTLTPERGCARPTLDAGCVATTFPTGGLPYSQVCGRVKASAIGTPTEFLFIRIWHGH